METCEICGNITNRVTWVKNCGVCKNCLIDKQLIEDCSEIDQDRINVLESVMREFISLDQSAYDSDNLRFEFKKQQEKFKGML